VDLGNFLRWDLGNGESGKHENISSYIPKYLMKSLKNWISKYVRF